MDNNRRKPYQGQLWGGVILIAAAFMGIKFYNKLKTKFDSDKILIASMYEAYNLGQK